MSWSFWFTSAGIILNLTGTVLLVFSLPTSFKNDSSGRLFHIRGNPWDLFHVHVIEKPDPSIILALILLVFGVVFQIAGLC